MLRRTIDAYLALRQAAGLKLDNARWALNDFARFAVERGDTHVRTATAILWASRAPSAAARERRLQTVIRLARDVRVEDAAHEVPAGKVFAHTYVRRRPHLFTAEQVCRLMTAAGRLGPRNSLRSHTYRTVFGLLASCGLRISEALGLRLEDVTADGLIIRKTKFRKNRLVPMHPTTSAALAEYLQRRRKVGGGEPQVFLSRSGRGLKYSTVVTVFLRLIRQLGIRPAAGVPGPRLHDLRHTFAVRVLEASREARAADTHQLLSLSTYLGHACISSTGWYLQATPTVMADIAEACEAMEKGGRS